MTSNVPNLFSQTTSRTQFPDALGSPRTHSHACIRRQSQEPKIPHNRCIRAEEETTAQRPPDRTMFKLRRITAYPPTMIPQFCLLTTERDSGMYMVPALAAICLGLSRRHFYMCGMLSAAVVLVMGCATPLSIFPALFSYIS